MRVTSGCRSGRGSRRRTVGAVAAAGMAIWLTGCGGTTSGDGERANSASGGDSGREALDTGSASLGGTGGGASSSDGVGGEVGGPEPTLSWEQFGGSALPLDDEEVEQLGLDAIWGWQDPAFTEGDCTVELPVLPEGMEIDLNSVVVLVQPSIGNPFELLLNGREDCAHGWTFDVDANGRISTRICAQSCELLQSDSGVEVEVWASSGGPVLPEE